MDHSTSADRGGGHHDCYLRHALRAVRNPVPMAAFGILISLAGQTLLLSYSSRFSSSLMNQSSRTSELHRIFLLGPDIQLGF